MDGYLYHDQLARMKFRLFHLLLEICKYHHHFASIDTCWYVVAPDYVCKFIGAHPYRSAFVPCLLAGGICHCSRTQSMSPCLWHMFLFQLQIISSIVKQQKTTGTTRLVNWLGSSTVCYRRSNIDLLCHLWSSGTNMCCPITPTLLQFLMGSFWPGHGCWRLSTRLGVHT